MAKEGSTVSGLMDTLATTISVALQYGVPLKDLVNKFAHVRFEPSGFTGNQEIPIAKSIVDYIFRWLGSRFLSDEDKVNLGLQERISEEGAAATPFAFSGGTQGSAVSSAAEPAPARSQLRSPRPPTPTLRRRPRSPPSRGAPPAPSRWPSSPPTARWQRACGQRPQQARERQRGGSTRPRSR